MPESVTDRPTSATEKIFMLTKSAKYFYDAVAVREPFADKRNGNPGTKGLRKYAPGDRQDVGRPMAWEKGAERGGRNSWNYWILGPEPFKGAHFAVFPTELVRRCIAAGSKEGDMVLDPFSGAGTTGLVAAKMERDAALIELNPEYCEMSRLRINKALGMLAEVVNG